MVAVRKLNVTKRVHEHDIAAWEAKGYTRVIQAVAPLSAAEKLLCDEKQCEDALRAEAKALGLKPHHAAKSATIQKMIDAAKAAANDG